METTKKVWLVTGSGNGLGRKIVEAALTAGNYVVATARDISQLEDLSAQYGKQLLTATLDVTDEEQAKDVVSLALVHFGRIDVLVNNAGYGDRRPFEQIPAEEFRKLIETCFFGVVTLTREVLPIMRKQRSGILSRFHLPVDVWRRQAIHPTMPQNGPSEGLPKVSPRKQPNSMLR